MSRSFSAFVVTVFLLGYSSISSAQWQSSFSKRSPDQRPTLKEVSKAFDEYWAPLNVQKGYYLENGVQKKAPGWKQFKRAEYFWEQRVNPTTGEFPTTSSVVEFQKSRFHLNKSAGVTSTASWTNVGTSSSAGGYAGIGRINCVAFHPTEANTYWVGSPSGGIWKTTNNGGNWTILNNDMPILGVSDIAVPSDYVTSNTLYIATGDREGAGSLRALGDGGVADNPSIGVYKSVNGGTTWTATGLTLLSSANKLIGRLLIASNNTTLFASTSDGIYKSTNSGTTWTQVLTTSHPTVNGGLYMIDMEFKPGDDNTIYASAQSWSTGPRIYRSTDGGSTWNIVYQASQGSDYRIELAVTPADPTVVYGIVCYYNGGYVLKSVLKSTTSGANFSIVWNGTLANHNLLALDVNGSDLTYGQGWYDLSLAASPTDADVVFVGGINTWYSTNGGTSWTIKTMWDGAGAQEVHADKHCLAFQNGSTLFECNDGGIYRAALTNSNWSDPGSNFVDKTNGMVISQLYRLGVSKTDVTKTITGLQDNGSKLLSSPTWKDVTGGDGMECIIDHTNPLYMYATYVQGRIYRNSDGFSSSATTTISNNISPVPTGAWVTPYIMDPTNSQTLYAGYDKVWKTIDRGNSWTALSGALSGTTKLRSLVIAPSNPDVMYTADLTHLWKTTNATTGTPPATWTDITGTLPVASASITYLAVKADDPQTVWVTFGGFFDGNKVFESTNGGTTWTSISGTLPNVPVLCIVQNTRPATTQLFIGTDAGVYAKDGTNDWILY
ncbi:MAG TPA: sialidase family protein, partial [Bacteroidota bacterium]|nr:sialidase family protein [Bacteroidota bacterium]